MSEQDSITTKGEDPLTLLDGQWPYLLPAMPRSLVISYLLWFFWGILGAHKLYLGRPLMAALYFFTGGVFTLGWLLDALTLPAQVREFRITRYMLHRGAGPEAPGSSAVPLLRRLLNRVLNRPRKITDQEIMVDLLVAAASNKGVLTVSQGVMATGLSFERVRAVLTAMVSAGYVDVRNDPGIGVVHYLFPELQPAMDKEKA